MEPKLTKNAIVAVHRPPIEGALSDYLDEMRRRPQWLVSIVQTGAPTAIVVAVRQP